MLRVDCISMWFVKMARHAFFVNMVAFVFVTAGAEEAATNFRSQRQSDDPNIFGVASIARVTSRNGRISSSGGIHFYPGPGVNGAKFYDPNTFIKAMNGKYGTSSVQIHPGALGVTSSAQAGYIDPVYLARDWPRQWQWPLQNQFVFGDPWHRVKELPQTELKHWVYPSFNPFLNFWR